MIGPYPQYSNNPQADRVVVRWYPNGTSAIATYHGKGVAAVTFNSTGNVTIRLSNQYRHILGAHHSLTSASVTSHFFVNSTIADGYRGSANTSSVTVLVYRNNALANIAAGTTEYVTTTIELSNSGEVV